MNESDWVIRIGNVTYRAPDAGTLHAWIAQGRVTRGAFVRNPSIQTWLPIEDAPDFAAHFGEVPNDANVALERSIAVSAVANRPKVRPHASALTHVLVVAALVAFVAALAYFYDPQDTGSPRSHALPEMEPVQAVSVSASDLITNYERNEIAADNAWKGRWVLVDGRVDSIGKDILDSPYVTLKGNSVDSFRSVQCFFSKNNERELAMLSPRQNINVRCRCDGLMGNVLLKDCELR